MSTMKIISALVISLLFTMNVNAAVQCNGTIEQVYKWHNMERISILLSSTNRWVNMPTKSDEAMALMAFASNKSIRLYWSAEDITSCTDGWANNRSLEGYFLVLK